MSASGGRGKLEVLASSIEGSDVNAEMAGPSVGDSTVEPLPASDVADGAVDKTVGDGWLVDSSGRLSVERAP